MQRFKLLSSMVLMAAFQVFSMSTAHAGYRCEGSFNGRCADEYVDTRGVIGAYVLLDEKNHCLASVKGSSDFDGLAKCKDMLRKVDVKTCRHAPMDCPYRCEGSFNGKCGNNYFDTRGVVGAVALVDEKNYCLGAIKEESDYDALVKCRQMVRALCY